MASVYQINSGKKSIFSSLSVNLIFVLINVVCFIVFAILIWQIPKFIDYIAIKPANILAGNYLWTIITSMFMHGGFFHIFANMLSLLFVGSFVERILGRKRYFFFYIFAGIFASLFFVLMSLIFVNELNTYAVGASGAIFGLIGLLMVLTPDQPVFIMFIPIPIKMKYAAPGMLLVLWLISIAGDLPIGNTAHLGGFLAGIVYGIYLRIKYKKKTSYIRKLFS
ncbi:MAG TPA: rhomboid family intramembrane serine protease [Candidatus Nanoarchaeia archaeon]|nr:rhomboid family intramembrane serine protease [Candidatus Nanoarchaeia archaeon]